MISLHLYGIINQSTMKKNNHKFVLLLFCVLFQTFFCRAQEPNEYLKWYQHEGTYDFGNNEKLTLGIFDEFNHSLVYLNLKTLKQGALIPIGKNQFKDINDSTFLFNFSNNKLTLTKKGIVSEGKKIAPHTRETVRFKSGNHTLEGDLYLPDSKEKHPIVVFAHGSGPSTRGVSFFTTYFLQLGIGVFTFDKQGAGKSEGDWETASLDELANDVVAAINTVKLNPNVNPKKIGILGNSQGGWVGSMAASKSKDVSFLLMRVGSGQNVLETIAHEYEGGFIADGFSKEEITEIMDMYRQHWMLAGSGQHKTWEDGNAVFLSYQNKSWFKKIYAEPRVKSEASDKWWQWLSKNVYIDSYDYLKQLKTTPVLWLLAEKDWNVNSQKSEPRVKEALTKAGNKDFTVQIIPNMGHTGLIVKTGLPNDVFSWEYAPGFWDTVSAWLKDRKITP
ncbi:alpha/beta hydrolase [Flavobacterium sp.]|uniref:alpha/beta hydrolase family protein n=1 Tax=Flavobacterium sp. TaxID=239 RepID=UPI0026281D13|nr:alpha/beta hydrolase [Flavobacterium sp.]